MKLAAQLAQLPLDLDLRTQGVAALLADRFEASCRLETVDARNRSVLAQSGVSSLDTPGPGLELRLGKDGQEAASDRPLVRLALRRRATDPAFTEAERERAGDLLELVVGLLADSRRAGELRARESQVQVLLGYVLHQLKTPLTSIRLLADILTRESVSGAPGFSRPLTLQVDHACSMMQELVAELAREAGGSAPGSRRAPEWCRASDLAEAVLTTLLSHADAKSVRLIRAERDGAGSLLVHVERMRMVQAICNLVQNGIKFAPPGGEVRIELATDPEGGLRIEVRDDGPGIARERLADLFHSGWQDPAHAHLGSGMGLRIAREAIESQRGRVWVESEPGAGCRFHVWLPSL